MALTSSPNRLRSAAAGFTLVELMVTLSVAAAALAVAVPTVRQVIMRNELASLANEFSASVQFARAQAISLNTCVLMCQSASTEAAVTGGAPACTASGSFNWLKGWVIYANRSCNTAAPVTPPAPADVLKVVQPTSNTYALVSASDKATPSRRILFNGRGQTGFGSAGFGLTLKPVNANDALADLNKRKICMSSAGRVTIRQWSEGPC